MPSRPTSDRHPRKRGKPASAPSHGKVSKAGKGADASGDGSVNARIASIAEVQQEQRNGEGNSGGIASIEAASSDETPIAGLPIGFVEQVRFDGISGWAWDPRYPNESIDIEMLDEDVVVLRMRADLYRDDLAKAGMGNGNHGFVLPNLDGVFPLSRHRIHLRRAFDGKDLEGSPAWITKHILDPRAEEFMERVVFSKIRTAETAADLGQLLNLLLRLVNGTIDAWHGFASTDPRAISPVDFAGPQLTGHVWDLVSNLQRAYRPLRFETSDEPRSRLLSQFTTNSPIPTIASIQYSRHSQNGPSRS
jgi:hypothetical protein